MKWKQTARRTLGILLVLVLSISAGALYSLIGDRLDRIRYPREYSEHVTAYATAHGVPEYIVYAVIKTESDFVSNAVSHAGAVGLMQITPDTFDWVSMLMKESTDVGMMYDPGTNIRYGTYLLSYLYMRYNRWDVVFAAYNAGMGQADAWLADPACVDEAGELIHIPFKETADYVKKVNDAIDVYRRLYY